MRFGPHVSFYLTFNSSTDYTTITSITSISQTRFRKMFKALPSGHPSEGGRLIGHLLSVCDPEAFILNRSTCIQSRLFFYFHSFHLAMRLSILDHDIFSLGPSSFNGRSLPSKSFHTFLTFYLPTSIDISHDDSSHTSIVDSNFPHPPHVKRHRPTRYSAANSPL